MLSDLGSGSDRVGSGLIRLDQVARGALRPAMLNRAEPVAVAQSESRVEHTGSRQRENARSESSAAVCRQQLVASPNPRCCSSLDVVGKPGPPRERQRTESETHFPACGTRLSICVNATAFRV
jgi:hypothetical protein